MKPILEIQNINKRFDLHRERQPYLHLRDSLSGFFKPKKKKEDFWALKDVSFTVERGDTVGIIGRNGAGKSTLLKILSRITPPTSGKIISRGRIASLLEVGTGFHGELNGRENIFMNGSILGMSKAEIAKNFDAIVDFSGVAKFIDTPLKHYSSGMQLRLAFAVAAFLENEVLIIDEVLAVGDAEFQKKCIGKMEDISKNNGRTLLFVSHDIEAVATLCKKGLLLNAGQIEKTGPIQDVISLYTNQYQDSFKLWDKARRPGDKTVKLNKVQLVDRNFRQIYQTAIDEEFGVQMEFEIFEDNVNPTPNFHFFTASGTYCFVVIADHATYNRGCYSATVWVPANLLNNQTYKVGIAMTTQKTVYIHFYEKEVINIEVFEKKSVRRHEYGGTIPGAVRPDLKCEIKSIK